MLEQGASSLVRFRETFLVIYAFSLYRTEVKSSLVVLITLDACLMSPRGSRRRLLHMMHQSRLSNG